MFRNFAIAAASVFALASAANAADMYRAPEAVGGYKDGPAYATVNWSGWYAGVNGGYGWSANDSNIVLMNNFAVSATTRGLDTNGGFGGGQIGYNWQGVWHPHLVLGIEADVEGSGITGKFNRIVDAGGDNLNASKDLNYFGTIRGRIGYAFDGVLVYGTGGFAYGEVHNRLFVSNGGISSDLNKDATETGFAAGGGIEYAISPRWSVKAEYQYIDLGSYKLSAGTVPPSATIISSNSIDNNFQTVRAGINYHVGAGYEPLK